jgi:hypothetical protein
MPGDRSPDNIQQDEQTTISAHGVISMKLFFLFVLAVIVVLVIMTMIVTHITVADSSKGSGGLAVVSIKGLTDLVRTFL